MQVIQMVLHTKNYELSLNKNKCTGCGMCMEICPKEAIQVTRTPKKVNEKAEQPTVTIDENKCHYCGICQAICPFGALTLKINEKNASPVTDKESFPQLLREIVVDQTKFGPDCLKIKDACPLDLIEVKKAKGKVVVEIDKDYCPGCRVCETKFPEGAIHVKKVICGSLRIFNEKCPEGCSDCVDVCPIPDVLCLSKKGNVEVNETHCVYCGACKVACPEDGALELERLTIRHTEVKSGAWIKALEKVASTAAVTKELRKKTGKKLKESVINRMPPEVLDYEF